MFMTLLALSSAHAVTFDAPGACGDSIDISVSELAPRGNFTFLLGYGAGDDVIPAGDCAGADSGLNMYTYTKSFRADVSGSFNMAWDMPEHFCDTAVAVAVQPVVAARVGHKRVDEAVVVLRARRRPR